MADTGGGQPADAQTGLAEEEVAQQQRLQQAPQDEDPVMIVAGRKLTDKDVREQHANIQRRMSDEDVRDRMSSARPKDHETRVHEAKEEFIPSKGLTTAEAEELLIKWGPNALEEKVKSKWKILLEQFTEPMPCMIWVAIVVECALTNWVDVGVLCALQFINGFVGFYETNKAGNAVAALKASLKPQSHCKRDGQWCTLEASKLVPGDLVLLGSGSAVPADCILVPGDLVLLGFGSAVSADCIARINDGQIDVDQAALTGESLPVTMGKHDNPKMGSTVTRGEVEATVDATGMNTFFGKTATLIQSVDQMGHLARILLNIMLVLLAVSFLLCAITLIYLLVSGESLKESISFVVVLLVASIPIAMEVVVTATMALGSRKLAEMNAIVARLAAIEELAGMNMLCSDKTGTLTLNKMVIQEDCPVFKDGVERADVIMYAALAAKWREPAKDALDTMVLNAANLDACDAYEQLEYTPFDPTLKRTEASLREKATGQLPTEASLREKATSQEFKVTKGAPHIVLELCHDKDRIEQAVEYKVLELAERGIRSLAVAKTDEEGHWNMLGIMTFLDPPRPDTKETIRRAMEYGVDVKMITGDHALVIQSVICKALFVIARETARQLGMGTNILGCENLPSLGPNGEIPPNLGDTVGKLAYGCNGFAQVFPEHKFLIVEALRQRGFAVGMTGDGVNDAPALKKADVGIAVQGATDAARASADIVLTSPGLSVVIEAIVISRCIFARMKNFIIYRVACTFQLIVFFFIAVLALHPKDYKTAASPADEVWPAFWTMPVIALILITVLNDGTIISIAYDIVVPNHRPDDWNLPSIYLISAVLGGVACISSLALLYMFLDSGNSDSLLAKWGFNPGEISYDSIVAAMYLKISLSDFLTLFAARNRGPFWTVRPGKLLMAAFLLAVGISTTLACTWPLGEGASSIDSRTCAAASSCCLAGVSATLMLHGVRALVWIYCLVWFLIQDLVKVGLYKLMFKYNILHINRQTSHVENYDESHFQDSRHPKAKKGLHRPHLGHGSKHKAVRGEEHKEDAANGDGEVLQSVV
ncbi:H+-exporting ATPase golden alga [Tribonema minus]|uniref:Plasma membrane ATPase n=1 Tax=Tribonema minus TaxID=303371 RepID=A0A835Z4J6_9STRA|nr:H+-exporting ATPase golden alga [Tribonema minus]